MDDLQKKKILQIGNFAGFIATVIVNFLAIGLPLNNTRKHLVGQSSMGSNVWINNG